MSSHHIIRENQEPALLILDIDAIDEELLGQLLEWSPVVLTIEKHVDFLLSRGIKIDVIFSATKDLAIDQDGVRILDIDESGAFTSALSYLKEKDQFSVHVLWNDFSKDAVLDYGSLFSLAIYSQNIKYILQTDFHKWMPKDHQIAIDYLKQDNSNIEAPPDLQIENIKQVDKSLYHVLSDGFVRIHAANNQLLLIGETL